MNSVAFISLTAEQLLTDQVWWDIYTEALPSNERESPQVIVRSLRENVGLAFSAQSADQTVAIATTHLLKSPAAVFLVYLATAHDLRGHGYGGRLLEFAWQTSLNRLSDKGLTPAGLILEVDESDSSENGEQKQVRERRITFFQRHQLKLNSQPYIQPPVDGVAPVVMSLMFRKSEGQSEPDSSLMTSLVRAIYFEKYHAINGIARQTLEALLGDPH